MAHRLRHFILSMLLGTVVCLQDDFLTAISEVSSVPSYRDASLRAGAQNTLVSRNPGIIQNLRSFLGLGSHTKCLYQDTGEGNSIVLLELPLSRRDSRICTYEFGRVFEAYCMDKVHPSQYPNKLTIELVGHENGLCHFIFRVDDPSTCIEELLNCSKHKRLSPVKCVRLTQSYRTDWRSCRPWVLLTVHR